MNEVFTIADEISVFRDGRYVGTDRRNLDQNKLITMMVGRELTQMFPKEDGADRRGGAPVREPRRSRACSRTSRSTAQGRDPGPCRPDRLRAAPTSPRPSSA